VFHVISGVYLLLTSYKNRKKKRKRMIKWFLRVIYLSIQVFLKNNSKIPKILQPLDQIVIRS
jgi:hypothetical protein